MINSFLINIYGGEKFVYIYVCVFCFFLCSSNRVVQPASTGKKMMAWMAKKKTTLKIMPGNSSNT